MYVWFFRRFLFETVIQAPKATGGITTMTRMTTMATGGETGISAQNHDLQAATMDAANQRSQAQGQIDWWLLTAALIGHGTHTGLNRWPPIKPKMAHSALLTPCTVQLMYHMACTQYHLWIQIVSLQLDLLFLLLLCYIPMITMGAMVLKLSSLSLALLDQSISQVWMTLYSLVIAARCILCMSIGTAVTKEVLIGHPQINHLHLNSKGNVFIFLLIYSRLLKLLYWEVEVHFLKLCVFLKLKAVWIFW